jgi:mono/diheme cytochrome c family protein
MRYLQVTSNLLSALALMLLACSLAPAQEQTTETLTLASDEGAKAFLARCSGCHTVGGGNLTGPDLNPATLWGEPDLRPAIKRMEAKAGPLADAEITLLVEFLRSGKARERIEAQEKLIAAASATNLEAPSPVIGRQLFHGTRSLRNGGTACTSCHALSGTGGNLGLDLTTVGSRMSETVLRAGIEKASYKIMRPIYAAKPIEAQEAAHLAAYLIEVGAANPPRQQEFPAVVAGAAGALLLLGLLAVVGRQKVAGTRRKLVEQANRS